MTTHPTPSKWEILEVKTEQDLRFCYPVMTHLHPHLGSLEEMLEKVSTVQKEGYRIGYVKEGDKAVSFVGFRIYHLLFVGRNLYVDDLCTLDSSRGKGYAGALLDWIKQMALEEKCDCVTLDSTYIRNNAHRLYLNKGYILKAHHFHLSLTK